MSDRLMFHPPYKYIYQSYLMPQLDKGSLSKLFCLIQTKKNNATKYENMTLPDVDTLETTIYTWIISH